MFHAIAEPGAIVDGEKVATTLLPWMLWRNSSNS